MGSVLRVLGRCGAMLVCLVLVTFEGTQGAHSGDCLEMPDRQLICNPTVEDEDFFRTGAQQPVVLRPSKPAPADAACQADQEGKAFLFRPPPANASFDDRLCSLMLSTGALPFGASHEAWLNPGLAFSSKKYPVWTSIRVGSDDPWLYTSRVSANRANQFWPLHLKQFGGPPLRYTLVEYRPSRSTPIEQFSAADQMELCADDFRQQIRKVETFLGVRLDTVQETLLERGIFTVADGARRPGYFIQGKFIRMEIWFGLLSTMKKGGRTNGLCRPFLYFQDLGTS